MDLAGLEWGRGGGIGGRGAGAAQVPLWTPLLALPRQLQEPGRERTPPKLDGYCAEQPGVMTKVSFSRVPCLLPYVGTGSRAPCMEGLSSCPPHRSCLVGVWGNPPFCPSGFCHWSACLPGLAHTPAACRLGVTVPAPPTVPGVTSMGIALIPFSNQFSFVSICKKNY